MKAKLLNESNLDLNIPVEFGEQVESALVCVLLCA